MGVGEPGGELDGHVEDALQGLLGPATVQAAVADPVLEAAALHELGEDARDAAQDAHVVAGDDVWVEPETHPCLGLADKVLPLAFASEVLWARALDREIQPPATVAHAIDEAHAA